MEKTSLSELSAVLRHEEELEKKDHLKSGGVTFGIALLLVALGMFWLAVAGPIPPIEEPEWQTIGLLADYGNMVEGSGDINSFEDPSPTPGHAPHNVSNSPSQSNPSNTPTNTNSENVLTDPQSNSGVQAPPANDNPKPNPSNASTPSNNSPSNTPTGDGPPGGSNHGKGTAIGNAGHPDATVLNDDGRFQFGEGIGGGGGRMPLKTDLPSYTVQEEAKIKFTIIIDPSGHVVFAKAEPTPYTELALIGKNAIMKWRFNEVDENTPNLKSSVTIKFRLQ